MTLPGENGGAVSGWPSVSIVQVAYNRRDSVRIVLQKMLHESDYEGDVEVIVVDNASSDGTADMLKEEFPRARVIERAENIGAPAWNDGFPLARGEWTLILDDDCYLPPDGLRKAVAAAREYEADLVSFRVVSTYDRSHFFDEEWWAGLFGFWGCAALVRTPVIQELGGYDREMFLYSNETDLMIRLLDRGYRHLHYPDVVAQHMRKPAPRLPYDEVDYSPRAIHNRHHGYTVGKLMHMRDALPALVAMIATDLRDGFRYHWRSALYWHHLVLGFVHGLRHRQPVRPEVSRVYRENYWLYAPPWRMMRPPLELLRALPRELAGGKRTDDDRGASSRRDEYFRSRARYYPEGPGALSI